MTIVAHDLGGVGGMERVLCELAIGLQSLGYSVTVIARTCELPTGERLVFRRVRGPRRPFVLAYPWFLIAGSLALRRWRRGIVQVTGAIVLGRVDVVAVHYCHQVGPVNPSRSGPLFAVNAAAASWLKRVGERVCFRFSRAGAVVCVSDGVAAEVREHYPELARRVVTIHNGVDTVAFAPGRRREDARALRERLRIDADRLIAVFVGSEWERKGLRIALEAIAQSPAWTLLVAGAGDRRRYQRLADSLGAGEAVRWLGVTADVELAYQLADAFVLPTAYETFSLAAFEAAASGLPVLATPVSGVCELIRDGENGFLITRDAREISRRLAQLADPELRRELGAAARRATERFTWRATVVAHHELYKRLQHAGAAGEEPASRSSEAQPPGALAQPVTREPRARR